MRDAGQASIAADRRDDCPGFAFDDERSGQELLADVQDYRDTLASQRRGVDGERVHLDRVHIGRDTVTCFQQHQVVDDQLPRVYWNRAAVTNDRRRARQEVTQVLGGPLSAMLLRERKEAVDNDDHYDRDA